MDSVRHRDSNRGRKARSGTKPARPKIKAAEANRRALQGVGVRLSIVASIARIAACALRAQSADHDHDVSAVLTQCVAEMLSEQVCALSRLTGRGTA